MLQKNTPLTIIMAIMLLFFSACGSTTNSRKAVKPITAAEYEYLAEKYPENLDGGLEMGLVKEQIYSKSTKLTFHGENADFDFTAYDVRRSSEGTPIALLVSLKADRLFNTLGGKPQRKQETYYFCIPSAGAGESLYKKYNDKVESMGYKDYEVFLNNLSRLLAELHL